MTLRSLRRANSVIPVYERLPSHLHFRFHSRIDQCESIFAMIRSAKAIASEIAHSDAGEFSHPTDSFRAARMQAAMRITRFLPSSTTTNLTYSLFVRHQENLRIFNAPSTQIPPTRDAKMP
jgi:hypothetical protein